MWNDWWVGLERGEGYRRTSATIQRRTPTRFTPPFRLVALTPGAATATGRATAAVGRATQPFGTPTDLQYTTALAGVAVKAKPKASTVATNIRFIINSFSIN